jgi:hypothetical protein
MPWREGDTSRCTVNVVFATELLELTNSMKLRVLFFNIPFIPSRYVHYDIILQWTLRRLAIHWLSILCGSLICVRSIFVCCVRSIFVCISRGQEIPRILRNPKIHCRIQKHPAPAPILSQVNPLRTSPSYLLMINFYIILPSTHMSSQWALSI